MTFAIRAWVPNIDNYVFGTIFFVGQAPFLRFIQLYTSPTYEDFHSLLVQPDAATHGDQNGSGHDEEKHRFSPIICRGVCDGGHIVWANTRISEGLTGRIDLPLNTAVGVPICSIGNDLYILVLFAVGLISMTPQAVEYLTTIARAVTEGSDGFLSASFSSTISVSPAKTEDFVGIWDINELVRKYGTEVEFHVFPVGKLQKFFDCHEILLFCDLFMDFKLTRDGRFTVKQLESLRETFRQTRERSDSFGSDASRGWDIENDFTVSSAEASRRIQPPVEDVTNSSSVAAAASSIPAFTGHVANSSSTGFSNEVESNGEMASSGDNSAGHGVYSADLNSLEMDADDQEEGPRLARSASMDNIGNQDINKSVLHIYAHMTYKLSQCRFHEFMIAVLGMTVFEASELWLVNERKSELQLVAAVYRSASMQQWIALSETLRLKIGVDLPGRVVDTGTSHWEADYSKLNSTDGEVDLRTDAARENGVHMAFGVPLPGLRGICGAVVFYSSRKNFAPESLLILLIERAVQLMATSSLDSTIFPKLQSPHQSSSDLQKTLAAAAAMSSTSTGGFGNNDHLPINRWRRSEDDFLTAAQRVSERTTLPTQHSMSTSAVSKGRAADFDQRLELARSIVSNRATRDELRTFPSRDQLSKAANAGVRKRNSTGRLKQLGALAAAEEMRLNAAAAAGGAGLSNGFYPPLDMPLANLPFFPPANSASFNPSMMGGEMDPVVNAAYALATFGSNPSHIYQQPPPISSSFSNNILPFDSQRMMSMYSSERPGYPSSNGLSDPYSGIRGVSAFPPQVQQSTLTAVSSNGNIAEGGATSSSNNNSSSARAPAFHKCKIDDCPYEVETPGALLCVTHRATRRCQKEGCNKCAQGATKFCIAHGGGRRCTFPNCFKGARDKFFCAAHGGGKRCTTPGCTKSAVGGSNLCTAHGGGKRCQFPGCQKSSQSSTNFCVRHGGGRSCAYPNCTKVLLLAYFLIVASYLQDLLDNLVIGGPWKDRVLRFSRRRRTLSCQSMQ